MEEENIPDFNSASVFIKGFQIVLVFFMVATVTLVLMQVFSRYVIEKNIKGVEELARLTLVWGCFLGSGYAALYNKHIVVDLIHDKTSARTSRILKIISIIVLIFVSGIMSVEGMAYVIKRWEYPDYSITLLFPRSLYYLPLPICGIIVFIHNIKELFLSLRGKKGVVES